MRKLMFLAGAILGTLSLTLTACGTRHSRISGGKQPVLMTSFGKTDQQIAKTLQTTWGKEWDAKDPKSQELANAISGVGVVTNSRIADMENVTVTIVLADCNAGDEVMIQTIKPGAVAQMIESEKYKVQIKCVAKDQSCDEYSVLISRFSADKKPEGSVAVFVRQNTNDFKKSAEDSSNEHSQVWWAKSKSEPMTASKALKAKAARCEVKPGDTKVEESTTPAEKRPMVSSEE